MDLDGLGVKLKTVLTGKELLEILALVALELDHLAHLSVVDDGAIAGCVVAKLVTGLGMSQSREWLGGWWLALTKLLLDDCENLLPAELCRDALNSGQGLTSISLCWASIVSRCPVDWAKEWQTQSGVL